MKPLLPAALLLVLTPCPAMAQRVSGTVLAEDSGAPVAGAIISAFAGRDTTAAVLARADGRFQIALPGRRDMTLLVRAIGMRPVHVPIRAGADTTINVRMLRITHTLRAVNVTGLTECRRDETGTADIVNIWLEVTNALENTRIARDSVKRRFHYVLYEILTDLRTGRATVLRNDSSSWVATRPFKVTSPRELASRGYVVPDYTQRRSTPEPLSYRAPDEMVLLDRSFQSSHCFWAGYGDGENDGLVGVHFLPVSGIRINDIRGVFWLDAKTYELKRLDYIYTRIMSEPPPGRARVSDSVAATPASTEIKPALDNPEPGGVLEFMRLPDGSFIVTGWRIYVNDTWIRRGIIGTPPGQPSRGKETGGLVVGMETRSGG